MRPVLSYGMCVYYCALLLDIKQEIFFFFKNIENGPSFNVYIFSL